MLKTKRTFPLLAVIALLALCICGCSKDEYGPGQGKLTVVFTHPQDKDMPVWIHPYGETNSARITSDPIEKGVVKKGDTSISFILNAGDYIISIQGYFVKGKQVRVGKESIAPFTALGYNR